MKTVDRILAASLDLLNTEGVARVSTNSIADAAELSVGNLYYHFKNKDVILIALFDEFLAKISPLLELNHTDIGLEQWAQWWHDWFAAVGDYGFIFHDQSYLKNQSAAIEHRYHSLIGRVEKIQNAIFQSLKVRGELIATKSDAQRMANEVTFIAFFWQDFYEIKRLPSAANQNSYQSALQQILGLLLPYLSAAEQLKVEALIAQAALD